MINADVKKKSGRKTKIKKIRCHGLEIGGKEQEG